MKNKREIKVINLESQKTFQSLKPTGTEDFERENQNNIPVTHSLRIKSHKDPNLTVQIIRLSQLTKILSVSRSCVYDWLNPRSPRHDPSFPKQIHLTSRVNGGAVGWRLESIIAWIESRS